MSKTQTQTPPTDDPDEPKSSFPWGPIGTFLALLALIATCDVDFDRVDDELRGANGIWTPYINEYDGQEYGTFSSAVCGDLDGSARRRCSQVSRYIMFASRCNNESAAGVVAHTRRLEGI